MKPGWSRGDPTLRADTPAGMSRPSVRLPGLDGSCWVDLSLHRRVGPDRYRREAHRSPRTTRNHSKDESRFARHQHGGIGVSVHVDHHRQSFLEVDWSCDGRYQREYLSARPARLSSGREKRPPPPVCQPNRQEDDRVGVRRHTWTELQSPKVPTLDRDRLFSYGDDFIERQPGNERGSGQPACELTRSQCRTIDLHYAVPVEDHHDRRERLNGELGAPSSRRSPKFRRSPRQTLAASTTEHLYGCLATRTTREEDPLRVRRPRRSRSRHGSPRCSSRIA